ncbi:hypothetical protein PHJA_001941100 [Phtheirospermum japonicum]|uniref:Uncharacterized protein n=1 Tax=Phtheirospermum japonicum TaxID=374723 RepID=A0A830CEC8_9LAMI|nr:hypothetical protein PHJA_001941100 [Phtheirospermum japonicum]
MDAKSNISGQKPKDDNEGQNIEDGKSLKRSFDAFDTRGDDDDDDDDDDDGSEAYLIRAGLYDPSVNISPIDLVFEHPNIEALTSRLKEDLALVGVLENILKSLKKENITSSDADGFSEMVKQVLENKFFLTELHQECQDILCLAIVNSSAIETDKRLNRTPQKEEKNEELIALIRDDSYFDRASVGGTSELVVRGVVSMLIAYCITGDELGRMGRRIGKVSPGLWGTGGD